MDNNSEDVDFDFFDTPRDISKESPKTKPIHVDSKPPKIIPHKPQHDGDKNDNKNKSSSRDNDRRKIEDCRYDDSDDSYSSFDSESDKSTPRNRKKEQRKSKQSKRWSSTSESSSAYSNSDYSSDEVSEPSRKKKEKIAIHMPKTQEAWSQDFDSEEGERVFKQKDKKNRHDSSSDSEDDVKENRSYKHKERAKSAKGRQANGQNKRSLRSSGSFSNNSDITDVSPLDSPENSPRANRKNHKNGKHNVQYHDTESPERKADIKLETEEIDLSILMKCMADIDREKQERLRTNSRRVMFAPPTISEKKKGNYTYSDNRAKMIEKENQRLLNQIMKQMNSGSTKRIDDGTTGGPRKPKRVTEPVIQRLTPSAVNRMREQRRIEAENMHILNRLQRVRPSQGMSKHEQVSEFERQMSYGIPSGSVMMGNKEGRAYSVMSQASGNRSRPSSAKSYTSVTGPGRRSRPSSAKSNASVISNASMRSTASKRSTTSVRSNMSVRSMRKTSDAQADYRPPWDDRFSYS